MKAKPAFALIGLIFLLTTPLGESFRQPTFCSGLIFNRLIQLPINLAPVFDIKSVEIASPMTMGGASREYFIAYTTVESGTEFKVYGAGPNGVFGDADDSGDRPIQLTSPNNGWNPNVWYSAGFGDTVVYNIFQGEPGPNQVVALFAKRPGQDGLLGRGGDDQTFIAATQPSGVHIGYGEGNVFDVVPNGLIYGILDAQNNKYVVRQDFVDNIPGGSDVFEVVNPDHPFFDGYFQTSINKVSSWQSTLNTPTSNDSVMWIAGPGPNGIFERAPSDDERYPLGGTGGNEMKGQLAYDASYFIDIFQYPSGSRPPQGTESVYLYKLIGGPHGRLTAPPQLQNIVPLPPLRGTPPYYIGPFVEFVDVDGPSNVAASLAVLYSYRTPQVPSFGRITGILYRDTGLNNIFFDGDDRVRVVTVQPPILDGTISDMRLKEDTVVIASRVAANQDGLSIVRFC